MSFPDRGPAAGAADRGGDVRDAAGPAAARRAIRAAAAGDGGGGVRAAAPPPPNPYNPLAWFVGDPVIGEGTWIGPFCLLDGSGGLVIGRGCDISAGAHIYTHSSTRRCVSDRAQEIERRPVRIGDCTFIGANAVILMGVTIGSHCVIGAGAVVLTDIPDRAVAYGVPARVMGTVDPATGALTRPRRRSWLAPRRRGPARRR